MSPSDKPLVWLHGKIKTPPFSRAARIEAGYLLRLLQKGQAATPKAVIDVCIRRLKEYDRA